MRTAWFMFLSSVVFSSYDVRLWVKQCGIYRLIWDSVFRIKWVLVLWHCSCFFPLPFLNSVTLRYLLKTRSNICNLWQFWAYFDMRAMASCELLVWEIWYFGQIMERIFAFRIILYLWWLLSDSFTFTLCSFQIFWSMLPIFWYKFLPSFPDAIIRPKECFLYLNKTICVITQFKERCKMSWEDSQSTQREIMFV